MSFLDAISRRENPSPFRYDAISIPEHKPSDRVRVRSLSFAILGFLPMGSPLSSLFARTQNQSQSLSQNQSQTQTQTQNPDSFTYCSFSAVFAALKYVCPVRSHRVCFGPSFTISTISNISTCLPLVYFWLCGAAAGFSWKFLALTSYKLENGVSW